MILYRVIEFCVDVEVDVIVIIVSSFDFSFMMEFVWLMCCYVV